MTQNEWDTDTLYSAGNGKVLIGSGAGRALAANLTAGTGVSITNGTNSITINSTAGGAISKISDATASSSATIDFTGLNSNYFLYILQFYSVAPATDGVEMWIRTSTDNGSTWDSGASDYAWANNLVDSAGASSSGGDAADSEILAMGRTGVETIGNAANEFTSGTIYIFNPADTIYTTFLTMGTFAETLGNYLICRTVGQRLSAADVDGVRILMSSGNISSGTFTLYGVSAT